MVNTQSQARDRHKNMTNTPSPLIHFPRARRVTLSLVRQIADTGESPLYATCDDGSEYWCKKYNYDAQGLTVVNEIVATEIGKQIGAPMRDWAIIDVPKDLAGRRVFPSSSEVYSSLPMFGSKHIPNARAEDGLKWLDRDGNYHRVPLLFAIWELCNAEDVQILYAMNDDAQVFSIDQGYWFASGSGIRQLDEDYERFLAGPPMLYGRIPVADWDEAIDAVRSYDPTQAKNIHRLLPLEWSVPEQTVMEMVDYVSSRVTLTEQKLIDLRKRHSALGR